MKVIVGSKNPVKLKATEEAFRLAFPNQSIEFETFAADSSVADQPMGLEETKQGAFNRADHCKRALPEADYWVGLEGGLEDIEGDYWSSSWMCVIGPKNRIGYGRTATFLHPPELQKLLRKGIELGEAADAVFNEKDSKQKGGTVGLLTDGVIQRHDFYREAIVLALVPFMKPELYG